ncbi:hypothetical protein, partial [Streptomyces reticuliscabiei]|uniref:hypothetical protein n=1 Tax=Streptomyces reticuliscabiei TaxID=146821 RepID=UPI001C4E79D8
MACQGALLGRHAGVDRPEGSGSGCVTGPGVPGAPLLPGRAAFLVGLSGVDDAVPPSRAGGR